MTAICRWCGKARTTDSDVPCFSCYEKGARKEKGGAEVSEKSSLFLWKESPMKYVHIYFNGFNELMIETAHGSLVLPNEMKDKIHPTKGLKGARR